MTRIYSERQHPVWTEWLWSDPNWRTSVLNGCCKIRFDCCCCCCVYALIDQKNNLGINEQKHVFFLLHIVGFIAIFTSPSSSWTEEKAPRVVFGHAWSLTFDVTLHDVGYLHASCTLNLVKSRQVLGRRLQNDISAFVNALWVSRCNEEWNRKRKLQTLFLLRDS